VTICINNKTYKVDHKLITEAENSFCHSSDLRKYLENLSSKAINIIKDVYELSSPKKAFLAGLGSYLAFITIMNCHDFTESLPLLFDVDLSQYTTRYAFEYVSLGLTALIKMTQGPEATFFAYVQTFINIWGDVFILGNVISQNRMNSLTIDIVSSLIQMMQDKPMIIREKISYLPSESNEQSSFDFSNERSISDKDNQRKFLSSISFNKSDNSFNALDSSFSLSAKEASFSESESINFITMHIDPNLASVPEETTHLQSDFSEPSSDITSSFNDEQSSFGEDINFDLNDETSINTGKIVDIRKYHTVVKYH
jgi:hypothetical protein